MHRQCVALDVDAHDGILTGLLVLRDFSCSLATNSLGCGSSLDQNRIETFQVLH